MNIRIERYRGQNKRRRKELIDLENRLIHTQKQEQKTKGLKFQSPKKTAVHGICFIHPRWKIVEDGGGDVLAYEFDVRWKRMSC